MRRVTMLAAAGLSVIAVAACGEQTIDADEVEDNLSSRAQEALNVSGNTSTVSSVECPDDVPAETGETFDCDVEFSDGTSGAWTQEVTDGDEGVVEPGALTPDQ